MKYQISDNTLKLLRRSLGGVVSLNDVFEKHGHKKNAQFWELSDPDAIITEWHGNRPYGSIDSQVHLDPHLPTGGYLSVLVDDLVGETIDRINSIEAQSDYAMHPDTLAEREQAAKAQAIVLNSAPRSASTTKKGAQNGKSFFLAISDNGVEVYVTPISQLIALDKRHRIIALYEIANQDNPVYANSEQFRSRLISRVRRRPDCLKPLFEYSDRAGLLKAKHDNSHPKFISHTEDQDSIVYVDRFGNLRLEFQDSKSLEIILTKNSVGQKLSIQIGEGKVAATFKVTIANSLREAPHEKLAIYTNKSDPEEEIEGVIHPRYAELVIQGDVTKPEYVSAAEFIQRKYSNFIGAPVTLL